MLSLLALVFYRHKNTNLKHKKDIDLKSTKVLKKYGFLERSFKSITIY